MLTVASIPAGHPYVSSVVDTSRVTLLPDPVPPGATLPGQWWPPRLLDPDYLRDHVGTVDVVHVHFGFEASSVDVLGEVVGILRGAEVPLVLTVHDLHNPHFADATLHLSQLDVLVPAAAVVVTLTPGAAAEIRRRWGRDAVVLPHPHVLPIAAVGAARPRRHEPVIAVHAKALRANIQPWPVVDALIDGGVRGLRLDLDEEAMSSAEVGTRVERHLRDGVDVRVHPRFTDDELTAYLTEVDVLVLPYRFGTHSGWVEACHDAGTAVVTPSCGFFAEQHPGHEYGYGPDGLDAASLLDAVAAAVGEHRPDRGDDPVRRDQRRRQADDVRNAMTGLYERSLSTSPAR
ncbi:hypothetical protein [Mycolicibacterium sp. P1-18]|uniref:hypothetical protein n=1 Tax=Mycolicibacterium sp. P1-18 TaxID=2024615 RepID=UPI001565613D|nr:hypothetical protein [Mycolicibacterium sp. P1-18]